jgi:hypothetical protein
MPLKITRRRFAGLSAAASVWVRPVLGETHEAAEWVNPLIGASTSQKLGEGKTFPGINAVSPEAPDLPGTGLDHCRFVRGHNLGSPAGRLWII